MAEHILSILAVVLNLISVAQSWCDDFGYCYYDWYSTWWSITLWVVIAVVIIISVSCCCYRRRVYSGVIMTQAVPQVTAVTVANTVGAPPAYYPGGPYNQTQPPSMNEYDNPSGYWHPPPAYPNTAPQQYKY